MTTIIACWLGWQLKWIRDREDFLRSQGARLTELHTHVGRFEFTPEYLIKKTDAPRGGGRASAKLVLWLFGAKAYAAVLLVYLSSEPNLEAMRAADMERAQALFPEAPVQAFTHFKKL